MNGVKCCSHTEVSAWTPYSKCQFKRYVNRMASNGMTFLLRYMTISEYVAELVGVMFVQTGYITA